MKKLKTILFLFMTSNMVFSQTLVQDNKLWNVVHGSSFYGSWTRSYILNGDTTINEITYKKLYSTLDTTQSNWSIYGAMRENENQVFFYDIDIETECLIYDFGLTTGDTFMTTIYDCLIEMTVEETDTISLLNGEQRKRYTFSNNEQWIAGVGSLNGLTYVGIFLCIVDQYYELSCCYESEEQIFQSPNYNDCYVITVGINDLDKRISHTISPNPFSNTTLFKFDYLSSKRYSLQIINSNGQIVRTIENITTGEVIITRNQLKTGFHFYKLQNDNRTIASGKLLVK